MEDRTFSSRIHRIVAVALLALGTVLVARAWAASQAVPDPVPPHPLPIVQPAPVPGDVRVEVAFVLDTTGSMSGLIEGAKRKIWSLANQLAANREGGAVRFALVGYRDRGDAYVTRRFDLTTDIDAISRELRRFRAEGGGDGPESVNRALHEAVSQLSWSPDDDVYKVIFLVGDAPPHMDYAGEVTFHESVRTARQRGIAVNTVQCGSWDETRRVWNQIASLGGGQFAAIAQDGGMVAMRAPQDGELAQLNRELAETVVGYGSAADKGEFARKVSESTAAAAPEAADRLSYLSKLGGRVFASAKDLVEATAEGLSLDDVAEEELPEAMQPMAPAEREAYLAERREKRRAVQARIDTLSAERDAWVAEENLRRVAEGKGDGFDARVMETIREQAAAKGITYE